jgi:hypothetical protein
MPATIPEKAQNFKWEWAFRVKSKDGSYNSATGTGLLGNKLYCTVLDTAAPVQY